MKRRLLTILGALVLAGLGCLMVFAYVRGADNRALRNQRSVEVLVAAKAIPGGTPVSKLQSDGYATLKRFPAVSVPDDVLGRISESDQELVISANIKGGELIRRTLLVQRGDTQAFTIPDGKIAVTVALTNPQRVAGYVKVGSKVAIFLTVEILASDGKPKSGATATKLIMSGVEVLSVSAADARATTGPAKDAAATEVKSLMTLAVTQRQAEKLVWGATGPENSKNGLYLGLEGSSSELNEKSPGVSSFTIFK